MTTSGYIGFTSKTVEGRWTQHKNDAKRYPHLTFYKALAKYGDRVIVTTLLEGSDDYCLDIENKLRPRNKIGWNIKIGGDFGSLGVIPSDETRKKMSDTRIGDKNHFFGKTHSDEQKASWKCSRGGRPFSVEAMRKSALKKAAFPWNVAQAKKEVWAVAHKIQHEMSSGLSGKALASSVGFSVDNIKTVVKKLNTGWNPLDDTRWQELRLTYQKECNESTHTEQVA